MTRGRVLLIAAAAVVAAGVLLWPYAPTVDHCTTAVEDYYHAHKAEIISSGGKPSGTFRDMRCAFLTQSQKDAVGAKVLRELFPEFIKDAFEHAFRPGNAGPVRR